MISKNIGIRETLLKASLIKMATPLSIIEIWNQIEEVRSDLKIRVATSKQALKQG